MIARLRRPSDPLIAAVSAAALFLAVANSAPGAVNPTEWRNRQQLEVASPGLTKIAVPIETLDLAQDGLVDLRILGPKLQETPYVVDVPAPPRASRVPARHFQVQLQKLATQLIIETGIEVPVEGIELETPARDFIKAAKLEISIDGKSWELVSDGLQLARGHQIDQRVVRFNKTAASFIRLTIDDWRTPAIPFTAATVLVAPSEKPPSIAIEAVISKRDEFATETVLTVTLPARHVPLADLELQVRDAIFSRPVRITERRLEGGESVEQLVANGFISRYQPALQAPREQLRLPLNFSNRTREIEVHIENGNSAPLAFDRVNLWRRPVWLTVDADIVGTYTVLTGHADITAPRYDLAAFDRDLRRIPETDAAIGPATPNPGYEPLDRLAQTAALGAPLDPAGWRYRKDVTLEAAGVHDLELDLEVLAHAQSDFADLRLMRDGQQVPYVLERTSLSRSFALAVKLANDPKQPRVSRWTATLPVEHGRIRRLTLSSATALFSRTVSIFETIPDSRGEPYRRLLAGPILWNATPERTDRNLVIALMGTPQTKILEIEIDDGDNSPISISELKADYPVVRVLFRSEAQPLQLFYGNDDATAPRYDLQLVAKYLLNQPRSRAMPGIEVNLAKTGEKLFSGVRGGVVLWSALGLVVIVLLVVIARLLPNVGTSEK